MHHDIMIDWKMCKQDFEWDGSWRDIYVFHTTLEDWRLLFALLRSDYQLEISTDGTVQSLPTANDDLLALPQEFLPHWRFRVGGLRVVCHFFSSDQMEFDVDPREITSQTGLDTLLGFVQRLGDFISKPVVLTPENGPEIPIITYDPKTRAFQYHEIAAS